MKEQLFHLSVSSTLISSIIFMTFTWTHFDSHFLLSPLLYKNSNIPQPIFHDVVKQLTFGMSSFNFPSLTFKENHLATFISTCRLTLEILVCHKFSFHGDVVTGISKILRWGNTLIFIKITIHFLYEINFLPHVIFSNYNWYMVDFSTTKSPSKFTGLSY